MFHSFLRSSARAGCRKLKQREFHNEALEVRKVPAIVWTNPGSSTNDADGFNFHFDGSAAAARAIVRQAISDWNDVITNFNYRTNISDAAPLPNTFSLRFEVDPAFLGIGMGATLINEVDGDGRPFEATIGLDSDSVNWFFDSTPVTIPEFTSAITANAASGLIGGQDFYTTVAHEIGHALGILDSGSTFGVTDAGSLRIRQFLNDTGRDSKVEAGNDLHSMTLDGQQVVFTTVGGGHLYEGTAVWIANGGAPFIAGVDVPGQVTHAFDLMTDGEAANMFPGFATGMGMRRTISDLDVRILEAVYGYSVRKPSTVLDSMHMDLSASGALSISGILPDSGEIELVHDNFGRLDVTVEGVQRTFMLANLTSINIASINPSGGSFSVRIADETQSGHNYTVAAGRLDSTLFPPITFSGATAVTLETGDGADDVTIESGPVTVRGGDGADTIRFEGGTAVVDGEGNPSAEGDTLLVSGTIAPGAAGSIREYIIGSDVVEGRGNLSRGKVTFNNVQKVEVSGQGGVANNRFEVQGVAAGVELVLQTVEQVNSAIEVGNAGRLNGIQGTLTIHGNAAPYASTPFADTLTLSDGNSTTDRLFVVTKRPEGGDVWTQLGMQSAGTIRWLGVESATLKGGFAYDTLMGPAGGAMWNLSGTDKGTLVDHLNFESMENLRGSEGSDVFKLAPGTLIRGTINGGGGTDTLDYSQHTAGVNVNLKDGTATGVGLVVGMTVYDAATSTYRWVPFQNVRFVENVTGGGGNDTLVGDDLNNVLKAGGGTNTVRGGLGNDLLIGGDGIDYLFGEAGMDILIGGRGSDELDGGAHSDLLIASATTLNDRGLGSLQTAWTTKPAERNAKVRTLLAGMIVEDDMPDTMKGGIGADWFWGLITLGPSKSRSDKIIDGEAGELWN